MVDQRWNEPAETVYCAHCQAVIPEGQRACLCCGEPIAQEGLVSRFFQWLVDWALRHGWATIDGLPAPGRPATKRQVFTSWDDVPPEVREQIDEARRTGGTVIRFRDETGEDRSFGSWDEVPEHLRAKIPPGIREQMAGELAAAMEQGDFASAGSGPIVVEQATTSRIVDFNVEQCRFGEFPRQDCQPTS